MNQGFQRFLQVWFESKPGQVVFNQEKTLVDTALANKFGYYLVQLGNVSEQSLILQSRISTKIMIDLELSKTLNDHGVQWIRADFDFLPIGRDKIDVVFMPHMLESVGDPYYVLRQVDSMLVPEGHVVVTGFNPAGCLPLRFKLFSKNFGFEKASYRRAAKVREWFKVLGYEVEKTTYSPVMCFSTNEKYKVWARIIEKIERSLQWLGFEFGNVYCIVAKKKVDSPTLVGAKWQLPSWKTAKNGTVASQRIKAHKFENKNN